MAFYEINLHFLVNYRKLFSSYVHRIISKFLKCKKRNDLTKVILQKYDLKISGTILMLFK